MLDSNILCNDLFCNVTAPKSQRPLPMILQSLLSEIVTRQFHRCDVSHSKYFLWTSFCIEVSNLVIDFSIFNSQYGHTSICSIWQLILNRILSIRNDVDMVHPIWKHFHIFQYYTSNYSQATNPRRTLDCPSIVV